MNPAMILLFLKTSKMLPPSAIEVVELILGESRGAALKVAPIGPNDPIRRAMPAIGEVNRFGLLFNVQSQNGKLSAAVFFEDVNDAILTKISGLSGVPVTHPAALADGGEAERLHLHGAQPSVPLVSG